MLVKMMMRLISELKEMRRMNLQLVLIPEMSSTWEICNWKQFRNSYLLMVGEAKEETGTNCGKNHEYGQEPQGNFKHFYQPLNFISLCVESYKNPCDFMQAFYPTNTGNLPPIPAVLALFHCLRQLSATALLW